ncbi:hypothetical protein [Streptomyces caelestis]|uniref:hypothetical protein n=1 Tax=Streptomyces caelestis TaxID=36816 RepID=UPI0036520D9A
MSGFVGAEPTVHTAGAVAVRTGARSLDGTPLARERPRAGEVDGRAVVVPHG